MDDKPVFVTLPVPIRRVRRYGVYNTVRGVCTEVQFLRHNIDIIDTEAVRLGITRSEFVRWATLQLADAIVRARGEEPTTIDE